MTGFDFERTASSVVPAPGASGSALVPARMLADALRAVGRGQDVLVESLPPTAGDAQGRVRVVGAGVTFELPTLPLTDFPAQGRRPLPGPDGVLVASMTGQDLVDLARVTVAAAQDETLPVLMVVELSVDGGRLRATATDRYRLAETRGVPVADSIAAAASWLVPARDLALVARSLRGAQTVTVTAEDSSRQLVFTAGGSSLRTTTLQAVYPEVHSLWPSGADLASSVTLDRDALVLGLSQVSALAPGRDPVRVEATASGVALSSGKRSGPEAAATKTLPGQLVGPDLRVSLRADLLLPPLRAVPAGPVVLAQASPNKPVVFAAPGDRDYRALLMPVRDAQT